jgi:hypothetical protein
MFSFSTQRKTKQNLHLRLLSPAHPISISHQVDTNRQSAIVKENIFPSFRSLFLWCLMKLEGEFGGFVTNFNLKTQK